MDVGDILIIDDVRTLVEVAYIINEDRFIGYWLRGQIITEATIYNASWLDMTVERDIKSYGYVEHYYRNRNYQVVGKMVDNIPLFNNEYEVVPSHFFGP